MTVTSILVFAGAFAAGFALCAVLVSTRLKELERLRWQEFQRALRKDQP